MTHNIDKLPKWAQYEIKRLRDENARLKEELQMAVCEAETKTYVASDELDKKARMFLPDYSRVRFELGPGEYLEVCRDQQEGHITVHGSNCICVQPVASNVVRVSLEKIP